MSQTYSSANRSPSLMEFYPNSDRWFLPGDPLSIELWVEICLAFPRPHPGIPLLFFLIVPRILFLFSIYALILDLEKEPI